MFHLIQPVYPKGIEIPNWFGKIPEEIISNEEIEKVHAYANFGSGITKREVVNQGVLKCASGYYQGHTSKQICVEHGLIKGMYREEHYTLTEKGKAYLWAAFKLSNSI